MSGLEYQKSTRSRTQVPWFQSELGWATHHLPWPLQNHCFGSSSRACWIIFKGKSHRIHLHIFPTWVRKKRSSSTHLKGTRSGRNRSCFHQQNSKHRRVERKSLYHSWSRCILPWHIQNWRLLRDVGYTNSLYSKSLHLVSVGRQIQEGHDRRYS